MSDTYYFPTGNDHPGEVFVTSYFGIDYYHQWDAASRQYVIVGNSAYPVQLKHGIQLARELQPADHHPADMSPRNTSLPSEGDSDSEEGTDRQQAAGSTEEGFRSTT